MTILEKYRISYNSITPASLDDVFVDGKDEKVIEIIVSVNEFLSTIKKGAGLVDIKEIPLNIYDGSIESIDRIISLINSNFRTIANALTEKATVTDMVQEKEFTLYYPSINKIVTIKSSDNASIDVILESSKINIDVKNGVVSSEQR